MGLRLVTPPAAEPLTLAEAKLHLRVEHSADDDLINRLIKAARGWIEGKLDRALITQTWDYTLDRWPYWDQQWAIQEIRLPRSPLISAGPIAYLGTDGVSYTLDAGHYRVSAGSPGRIRPAPGRSWPSLWNVADAVTVRFVCGYGNAAAVPETTKQAMQLLIGHWNQNREAVLVGTISKEIELAVQSLLACEDPGVYS